MPPDPASTHPPSNDQPVDQPIKPIPGCCVCASASKMRDRKCDHTVKTRYFLFLDSREFYAPAVFAHSNGESGVSEANGVPFTFSNRYFFDPILKTKTNPPGTILRKVASNLPKVEALVPSEDVLTFGRINKTSRRFPSAYWTTPSEG